ncbi:hypothetical protein AVEN_98139-1 [Araneus ventricosus]|uniref:RNA-directed DNA polymerase n=1 Tax=Araneus ventricosus TaxID=182803 RepID=A0A4Y2NZQ6_ARAVE|nr:hypothetical protein AVEN_98139-1 [Araneus ventricosus]
MKALARSFVYWKDIDKDIEEAVRNCVNCARHKTDPAKDKVNYWEYPSVFEFRDRKFDIGDKVAVRIYRAANSKWKFSKIVNGDGVLHYTVEVQGTLVRRHVDQIRPVGDHVQENDFIPNVHRRFPATDVRESNSNLQHAETAQSPSSKVPNEEQGPSSTPAVLSTDVSAHDSPPSDVQLNSSSIRSLPVPTRQSQVPRRSCRIRRPPKRLDL